MATRFYWGQIVTNPAIAVSTSMTEGGAAVAARLIMRTVKRKANVTSIVVNSNSQSSIGNGVNQVVVQLISMPLSAQTITGTVTGYALFSNGVPSTDPRVQCEIRIISPTNTVRGTLLAANTDALSSEIAATPTNRRIPLLASSNTLTSVAAQDGDRLVIDLGYRAHVGGTTPNVTLRWNDEIGSTDLPEDEIDTDTTKAPWIEFSQNLVLIDYFDDNTLTSFKSSNNGAEPTKAPIPDLASPVFRSDILATLATLATSTISEDFGYEVQPTIFYASGAEPSLYFDDNTLISFKSSSNSAEPTKAPIPDVAPKDRRYDVLASLATPAIYEDFGYEVQPTIFYASGTEPSLAFDDNTLTSFKSSSNSAEPTKAPIPDLAPKDRRYNVLASLGTSAIYKDLVSYYSTISTVSTSYLNRAYDSTISKFVFWSTFTPDITGISYPGPGVFGVTAIDHMIISTC